jgi:hypothetical protein
MWPRIVSPCRGRRRARSQTAVPEDNPGNAYHVPLNPGAQKRFGNADMSGFTCCNGTALESHTKLQDSI